MTIKTNRVNADITVLSTFWRKVERDLTSTTALSILDRGASSLARRRMLALGAIRHGEDEVNVGVKRD
jgi:hypothetical protein